MLTYQTYICFRRTVTTLARVFIVIALLVNIGLPFLDHHYVERQPLHKHVYFEGVTGHTHEFEKIHNHHPIVANSKMASLPESQGVSGLIMLVSRDIGNSHSHALPSAQSSLLSNFSGTSSPLLRAHYTNTNVTNPRRLFLLHIHLPNCKVSFNYSTFISARTYTIEI